MTMTTESQYVPATGPEGDIGLVPELPFIDLDEVADIANRFGRQLVIHRDGTVYAETGDGLDAIGVDPVKASSVGELKLGEFSDSRLSELEAMASELRARPDEESYSEKMHLLRELSDEHERRASMDKASQASADASAGARPSQRPQPIRKSAEVVVGRLNQGKERLGEQKATVSANAKDIMSRVRRSPAEKAIRREGAVERKKARRLQAHAHHKLEDLNDRLNRTPARKSEKVERLRAEIKEQEAQHEAAYQLGREYSRRSVGRTARAAAQYASGAKGVELEQAKPTTQEIAYTTQELDALKQDLKKTIVIARGHAAHKSVAASLATASPQVRARFDQIISGIRAIEGDSWNQEVEQGLRKYINHALAPKSHEAVQDGRGAVTIIPAAAEEATPTIEIKVTAVQANDTEPSHDVASHLSDELRIRESELLSEIKKVAIKAKAALEMDGNNPETIQRIVDSKAELDNLTANLKELDGASWTEDYEKEVRAWINNLLKPEPLTENDFSERLKQLNLQAWEARGDDAKYHELQLQAIELMKQYKGSDYDQAVKDGFSIAFYPPTRAARRQYRRDMASQPSTHQVVDKKLRADLRRLNIEAQMAFPNGDKRAAILLQGSNLIVAQGWDKEKTRNEVRKLNDRPTLRDRVLNKLDSYRDLSPTQREKKVKGVRRAAFALAALSLLAAAAVVDDGKDNNRDKFASSSRATLFAGDKTVQHPPATMGESRSSTPSSVLASANTAEQTTTLPPIVKAEGDGPTQAIARYARAQGVRLSADESYSVYQNLNAAYGGNFVTGVGTYTMANGDLGFIANSGQGKWAPGVTADMDKLINASLPTTK